MSEFVPTIVIPDHAAARQAILLCLQDTSWAAADFVTALTGPTETASATLGKAAAQLERCVLRLRAAAKTLSMPDTPLVERPLTRPADLPT